jgi:hypothetical protein
LNKSIFTIITFQKIKDLGNENNIKSRGKSTIGFMHDKQKAIQLVLDNACDIHEGGFYPYALVNEVPEGIYGINPKLPPSERLTWFLWDNESNCYKIIDKCPNDLEGKVFF